MLYVWRVIPTDEALWKMRLLSLFFIIFSGSLFAQSFSFKHYTVEDGLNTSTVYYATQDLQGNMWFATEQGVCKFDGRAFTRYTINDGLSDNEVLFTKTDSKGRIWFLTLNGHLSFYYKGKFCNEKNTLWLKKAYLGRSYNNLYEDSQHRLFFGGFGYNFTVIKNDSVVSVIPIGELSYGTLFFENPDRSINVYVDNNVNRFVFKEDKLLPIQSKYTSYRAICTSYTKRYQFGISKEGLIKRQGNDEEILIPNSELIPNLYLTSATEHADSSILITSRSGVIWFPKNVFKRTQAIDVLTGKIVLSHFTDSENNFWFCTEGDGIYMLPDNQMSSLTYTNADGLANSDVNRVIKDDNGNIWLACDNGNVSEIIKNGVNNYLIEEAKAKGARIRDIAIDRFHNVLTVSDEGVVWIKTTGQHRRIDVMWDNGLGRATQKGINRNFDNSISATMTDGVLKLRYNKKNEPDYFEMIFGAEYENLRTYSHFYDRRGRLWVCNIRGFCLYKDNKVLQYFTDKDSLLRSRIVNIGETPDSALVLSTEGYGVIFFKNDKIINHFSEANGLSSNVCKRLFIKGDVIWVSTNLGLTKVRYRNNSFEDIQVYNKNNGLLSNAVKDVYVDGDTVYVGTEKGLCIIKDLSTQRHSASPQLFITDFVINGQNYANTDTAYSFAQNNPIKINYSAATFQNPAELKYRYRLPGINPEWVETKNNSVEYSFLGAGKHLFEVQAKKVNSDWSKTVTASFIVVPPFYKTTWFYIIILAAAGFIIYYITRIIIQQRFQRQLALARQNEMIEHERMRIASDMHDDIGADLTQISIWTNILKVTTKNEVVDKIVTSSNDVLQKVDSIIWALDSVHDHAEDLISYVRQYALNYLESSDISLSLKAGTDMPDMKLSATQRRNIFLVIKELLHNTVKHSGASKVTMQFSYSAPHLIINYADNGKGFDPAILGDGLGFTTLEKRMAEINSAFNFTTAPGKGFSAEMQINYKQ